MDAGIARDKGSGIGRRGGKRSKKGTRECHERVKMSVAGGLEERTEENAQSRPPDPNASILPS